MITENEQALEAAYWAELEKRNEYASWVEAQVEAQEADEDEDGWDPRNDRW